MRGPAPKRVVKFHPSGARNRRLPTQPRVRVAVDAGAPDDPGCAASLIGYGALPDGDRALLTTPYPTNDREPQALSGSGIDLCLLSLAWHVGAQLRILARTNARTPKRQRADAP